MMSRRSSSRDSAATVGSPSAKRARPAEPETKEDAPAVVVPAAATKGTPETTNGTAAAEPAAGPCECQGAVLAKLEALSGQMVDFMERQEAMNASLAEQQANITEAVIAGFSQQAQLASLAQTFAMPTAPEDGREQSEEPMPPPPKPSPPKWSGLSLLSGGGGGHGSGLRGSGGEGEEVTPATLESFAAERSHIGASVSAATAEAMAKLGFPLETAVRAYKTGKATRFCILKSYLWQAVKLDCERGNLDYKDIICAAKEGEGMDEYIERQPVVVRRAIRLALMALATYKNFPKADGYDNSELFAKLMGACRHLREMGRKVPLAALSDSMLPSGVGSDLGSLSMALGEEANSSAFLSSSFLNSSADLDAYDSLESPEEMASTFVREKEHIGARLSDKDALEMSTLGFTLKAVRNAYKIGKASKFCILKSYLYQLTKPDYERGALDYKDIIGSPKEDEGMAEFIERQPDIMNKAVQMSFKALQAYPGFPAEDQTELFSRLIGALRHCRQNLPRNKVTGPGPSSVSARASPATFVKEEDAGSESAFVVDEEAVEEVEPASPSSLERDFVTQAPNIGADVPEEDAIEMSKLGFPLRRIVLAYKFAKASRFCVLKSMLWQLLKTECEKGSLDYRDIIVNPREGESLEAYLHRQPDLVMRAIKVAILALYHYPDFPSQNEAELFTRIVHANRYIGKQGACKVYRGPSFSSSAFASSAAPTLVPLQTSKLRPDDLLGMLRSRNGSATPRSEDGDTLDSSTVKSEPGSEDLMDRIAREPSAGEKEAAFVKAKAHVGADLTDVESADMSRMGFSLKLLSDAYKFAKSSRHCVLKSYLWQIIKHENSMDYRDVVVTPKEGHTVAQHVQRQPDPIVRATQLAFKAFQRYPDFAALADDEAVFAKLVPAYRYVRESARHKSGVSAKGN